MLRKDGGKRAVRTNANSQILLLLLHMNLGHTSRVDASIAFPVRQKIFEITSPGVKVLHSCHLLSRR